MKARILSFVLLSAAVVSMPAAAQEPAAASTTETAAARRIDVKLANEIGRQILNYTQFTIFDHVAGRVDNGVARLTGKVTMPFKREELGKRVGRISGVKEVVNEIQVLPVSGFDERLRQRISRAIYGNQAFWAYAAQANPPIHIVVENGHVTLTGVVNSNVDKMLARSLATGFGELSVTNQLLTDSEARAEARSQY